MTQTPDEYQDDGLYDLARKITDEVLGEGTFDKLNRDNPDPGIQAAIARAEAFEACKKCKYLSEGKWDGAASISHAPGCPEAE